MVALSVRGARIDIVFLVCCIVSCTTPNYAGEGFCTYDLIAQPDGSVQFQNVNYSDPTQLRQAVGVALQEGVECKVAFGSADGARGSAVRQASDLIDDAAIEVEAFITRTPIATP